MVKNLSKDIKLICRMLHIRVFSIIDYTNYYDQSNEKAEH